MTNKRDGVATKARTGARGAGTTAGPSGADGSEGARKLTDLLRDAALMALVDTAVRDTIHAMLNMGN